ncbi:MAG: glycosyltransferase family 4 protein [Thermoplasmatales archaeon]
MQIEKFDFVFVLGSYPIYYPTRGDYIVFKLCEKLYEKGYRIGVFVMKPPHKWLGILGISDQYITIKLKLYSLLQNKLTCKYLFPILRYFRKTDYDYSFLRYTKVYFLSQPDGKFLVQNLIAAWWGTAYFVADDSFNAENKYYLIQNEENDPTFSGSLHEYASKSYELPLKKIVINETLAKRFKLNSSSKMRIGINLDLFKIINPINSRDRKKILFTLRVGKYKGAEYALEVISILHVKCPELILVGFGNMHPNRIPDYVTYYYMPSRSDVCKLYNECSIFVSTFIVEGFSLMPLEAMACGACVISSYNNGVVEYLKNDFNGLLVIPRDAAAIVTAVSSHISDDNRRKKLVINGNLTAESYTYDNMVEDFLQAISNRTG